MSMPGVIMQESRPGASMFACSLCLMGLSYLIQPHDFSEEIRNPHDGNSWSQQLWKWEHLSMGKFIDLDSLSGSPRWIASNWHPLAHPTTHFHRWVAPMEGTGGNRSRGRERRWYKVGSHFCPLCCHYHLSVGEQVETDEAVRRNDGFHAVYCQCPLQLSPASLLHRNHHTSSPPLLLPLTCLHAVGQKRFLCHLLLPPPPLLMDHPAGNRGSTGGTEMLIFPLHLGSSAPFSTWCVRPLPRFA